MVVVGGMSTESFVQYKRVPAGCAVPAQVVKLWQGDLAKINPKAAESLANPDVSCQAAPARTWPLADTCCHVWAMLALPRG